MHQKLNRHRKLIAPSDWILVSLWGNKGVKTAELFGYGAINRWPGNPNITSWVFKDGIYQPGERQVSCGETFRVLGREEDCRIRTKSLQEYMGTYPRLGDLEPPISF